MNRQFIVNRWFIRHILSVQIMSYSPLNHLNHHSPPRPHNAAFDPIHHRLLAADQRVLTSQIISRASKNAWIIVGGYSSVIKGPWGLDWTKIVPVWPPYCATGDPSFKPQLEWGRYRCCSLGRPTRLTLKWNFSIKSVPFPTSLPLFLSSLALFAVTYMVLFYFCIKYI